MVRVRIEEKPAFEVTGRKTWIGEQDNEKFGEFWAESKANGLTARLAALAEGGVMGKTLFGVSRVEADPANRTFYFYIAAETKACPDDLEHFTVPAARWAIFSNCGELPMSLIEAEMYCHMGWMPASPYRHAAAPELEVYPADDPERVEYWLPIAAKDE